MKEQHKAKAPDRTTLDSLIGEQDLEEGLRSVERLIRVEPGNMAHRRLRFDLLCLLGRWEKALVQLQTCARMDKAVTPEAYVYRDLVQSERFRAEVFAGRRAPVLPETTPEWLTLQLKALRLQGEGDTNAADAAREEALGQAGDVAGHFENGPEATTPGGAFQWIADSDTRLGPVLEAFLQGQYRWIPFAAVTRISLTGPVNPRDFLWLPVQLEIDSQMYSGFLPGRYPGSESGPDSIRLGRETRWEDSGRTCVRGLGQKVWMTDQGDIPLFDLREMTFRQAAPEEVGHELE